MPWDLQAQPFPASVPDSIPGLYCPAMRSRPLSEHVRRLSAIAERRRAPGAVFCLAVAETRTVPVAYVRRAVEILRSLPR